MSFCSTLYMIDECENSLEWAKSLLAEAPHGSLFLAAKHNSPRGRQGRVWQTMPGQLLLTFVLKPPHLDERKSTLLFMAISLAFLQPLKAYGVGLKWPNDFVCKDKKVGGMLIEIVWQGDTVQGVIVGLGLNVNTIFPTDHPLFSLATSLRQIIGFNLQDHSIKTDLCQWLETYYQRFEAREYEALYEEWKQAQVYRGKSITVHRTKEDPLCGVMNDVTQAGDLVLVTSEGIEEVVTFTNTIEIRAQ